MITSISCAPPLLMKLDQGAEKLVADTCKLYLKRVDELSRLLGPGSTQKHISQQRCLTMMRMTVNASPKLGTKQIKEYRECLVQNPAEYFETCWQSFKSQ